MGWSIAETFKNPLLNITVCNSSARDTKIFTNPFTSYSHAFENVLDWTTTTQKQEEGYIKKLVSHSVSERLLLDVIYGQFLFSFNGRQQGLNIAVHSLLVFVCFCSSLLLN